MNERDELKRLAERITRAVCDVRLGNAPTRREIDRLQTLRRKLSVDYDAINGVWEPWNEETE